METIELDDLSVQCSTTSTRLSVCLDDVGDSAVIAVPKRLDGPALHDHSVRLNSYVHTYKRKPTIRTFVQQLNTHEHTDRSGYLWLC